MSGGKGATLAINWKKSCCHNLSQARLMSEILLRCVQKEVQKSPPILTAYDDPMPKAETSSFMFISLIVMPNHRANEDCSITPKVLKFFQKLKSKFICFHVEIQISELGNKVQLTTFPCGRLL